MISRQEIDASTASGLLAKINSVASIASREGLELPFLDIGFGKKLCNSETPLKYLQKVRTSWQECHSYSEAKEWTAKACCFFCVSTGICHACNQREEYPCWGNGASAIR